MGSSLPQAGKYICVSFEEEEYLRKLNIILTLAISAVLLVGNANAGQISGKHQFAAGKFSAGLPLGGETFTHAKGGIQFDLPSGWKAEPDGEQIVVSSADETLTMVLSVAEEDEFQAAVEGLHEELGKTIHNMKVAETGKEDKHNGMDHFTQHGTGEIEGANIVWSVDLLMAKKPVIVLTFASTENLSKNAKAYIALVASIKRVK